MRRLLLALPPLFLLSSLDGLGWGPSRLPVARTEALPSIFALLPARNSGRFARLGDPLNMVFVATPQALRAALVESGWTEVPRSMRASLCAGLGEFLSGRRLAAFPPMNDYSLEGRRQDINWALPVRAIAERHHFRLWDLGLRDEQGRTLWWGSGNYDRAVRWRDLSHIPDPNMDLERDFMMGTLAGSALLETAELRPLPQIPREGTNDKGYAFRTDGRAGLLVLRATPSGVTRRRVEVPSGPSSSSSSRISAPPLRPTTIP